MPNEPSFEGRSSPKSPNVGNGAAEGTTGTSSGISGPTGHTLRRTKTTDESIAMRGARRQTPARRFSSDSNASIDRPTRRGSNFSDYSFSDARDVLNPHTAAHREDAPETSSLAGISLIFALLPAISGAIFNNGHAVVTDVLLLGLAGVFLHWSVTQPWSWYYAAQQVRVQHEAKSNEPVIEDSDAEDSYTANAPLEDVPEEGDAARTTESAAHEKQVTPQQQYALRELYIHEVLALVSCFVLPFISAYLLHAIRSQLSRPSEGLVSNFNLTVFLLVAELRALSHMIKLVQARTLHLQRVVHADPYSSPTATGSQLEDVLERLELLESRAIIQPTAANGEGSSELSPEATIVKDVRQAIQPDLDALNRAVRRYEKKATTLQFNTDSRFGAIDARLDDAIALAAVAAKNSKSSGNFITRLLDSLLTVILFPLNTILQVLTLPLRPLLAFSKRGKQRREQAPSKPMRAPRSGKLPVQPRYGTDRASGRVPKR